MQTFFLFALIIASVGLMVIAISKWKIHPFIVMTVIALLVGLIWGTVYPESELTPAKVVSSVKSGFGDIMTSIGIVILCGTIIGTILEKTGAALTMANAILKLVGKKNSVVAMGAMGYVTGIPVFCDSGFVVLSPISRALAAQSNVSLAVMGTALSGGLYATHCLVPPTPGPIAMAGTHEALLQRFARERIPIMIGTQMITKGLNFENVTLVGVLNADQSLYVGDYRANERTFSLITQVIGRSGRGDAPGRAVIQTFTPANETIQQAARQDYDAFYRSEIRLRKLNGTPPFSEVLAVTVSGAQENAVVRCCAYIRDYFRQTVGERAEVLGPAPLPVVRMNNRYRYRVTLYCNQSKAVRRAAANIVMYCNTEKSFRDVTVFADDNPLD